MQINTKRVLRTLMFGILVYVIFLIVYFVKIEIVQFKWKDGNNIGCVWFSKGLKISKTVIFSLPGSKNKICGL